jgi:hypothetical protein
MHTDPKFVLTPRARRFLTVHPGPLGAEYQPRQRRTTIGPITVVEGGRR